MVSGGYHPGAFALVSQRVALCDVFRTGMEVVTKEDKNRLVGAIWRNTLEEKNRFATRVENGAG